MIRTAPATHVTASAASASDRLRACERSGHACTVTDIAGRAVDPARIALLAALDEAERRAA